MDKKISITSKFSSFIFCLLSFLVLSVFLPSYIFATDLQGGNSVVDRNEQDSRNDFTIVDTNVPINGNGYLISWSIYARKTVKVQLKVIRKAGSDYKVMDQSDLVTPVLGSNQFDLTSPIYVLNGDLVGLYFEQGGVVPFTLDNGSYSRGDLEGKTLFTASGINPDLDQVVPFSDSSDRTYSVAVNGIVEYKVDDDNLDCPEAAYKTIQEALAETPPGETIQVCKGTYDGPVNVTNNGIAIVSLNGSTDTIVKAGNAGGKKYGFRLFADNITIQNFTIRDADVAGSAGIIIGANKIINPTPRISNNAVISGNVFDNNNFSIYAWKSNNNFIKSNMIINGKNISGNESTIVLVGNSNEISGNKFEGNSMEGIILNNSSSNKISSNSIDGSGIKLVLSSNNNIVSNLIKDALHNGIQLDDKSKQNKIKTNSVSGSKGDGILAGPKTEKNVIQNNMVKNSSSFDVHDLTSATKKGVKNTWIMNMCGTSSPVGLCFK